MALSEHFMNPSRVRERGLVLSQSSINGLDYNYRTEYKCLTHADGQRDTNQEVGGY